MKKQLYLSMGQTLQRISDIKWVDWDFGQFRDPELREPFPLPAVLLSFGKVLWKDLSEHVQEGELDMYIDLYVHRYGHTHAGSATKTQTLQHLDLLDEIYRSIHHVFHTDKLQALVRVREETLDASEHVLAFRQVYSTRLIDDSAQATYNIKRDTNLRIHLRQKS